MPKSQLPTGAGLLALLAILGVFEASQNAPEHDDTDRADGDQADEPRVHAYTTDAEARSAFLADNRDVIENEAVAMVVVVPNADGELRARVLSTSGACAYEQGSVLLDVAEEIGANHNARACATRRRAAADARA